MSLHLQYRGGTQVPVEVEGLLPEKLRGMPPADIERLPIQHGNRQVPAGEFFRVRGQADDLRVVFEGDLSGVHWIGARMTEGEIRVEGQAGRHLGSEMRGGSIQVQGDAGDWIGAEMHKGLIEVRGSAGHQVGAAYRGSPRGMTGGMILVHGSAGNEIGLSLRRGQIAIGGDAGDFVGVNLIAGTILVFGQAGIRHGAEMRRGTIVLFGKPSPPMLPTFRAGCVGRPIFLRLMLLSLARRGFPVAESHLDEPLRQWHGDLLTVGRGEIFVPA